VIGCLTETTKCVVAKPVVANILVMASPPGIGIRVIEKKLCLE